MKKTSRILAALSIVGSVLLLCLCTTPISTENAPPPQTSLYLEPRWGTVWPSEKEPFLDNSHYREREALFMAFQPGTVDLVCLGDSITQKFEWQDALTRWRVANRGIGSDTTEGMLARLDSIKALNPAAISLMAGINDLVSRTPEEVAVSYAALLDALARELPKCTVIVSGVLPVREDHPIDNWKVRTLNEALAGLCRERGLCFLDLYWEFAGEDGNLRPEYAFDTAHITAEGYRLWLSHLVPALEEALN